MLAIKFQRVGKKRQPSYRIVVAEKRSKLGGPPVEQVGAYDLRTKTPSFKKERILYWLGVGAKPTASIHNLFVKHGILSAPKVAIKIRKKKGAEEAAPAGLATEAAAGQAEAGSEVTAPAAQPETAGQPEAAAQIEGAAAQTEAAAQKEEPADGESEKAAAGKTAEAVPEERETEAEDSPTQDAPAAA